MQITRNSLETNTGPSEWFTGTVYIDIVATPSPPSRLQAAGVHFAPGARTAWHTHPYGQTIYVTEGIGRCQRSGGPIEVIRPGDRVYFEPEENHWHGAAPDRLMTHIAMQEANDQGIPVTWGEHVTDEEYNASPASKPPRDHSDRRKPPDRQLGALGRSKRFRLADALQPPDPSWSAPRLGAAAILRPSAASLGHGPRRDVFRGAFAIRGAFAVLLAVRAGRSVLLFIRVRAW